MKEKAEKLKTDRRGFLKLAGIGSVAGSAALVTGKKASAKDAGAKLGYRETPHIQAFYKSARF